MVGCRGIMGARVIWEVEVEVGVEMDRVEYWNGVAKIEVWDLNLFFFFHFCIHSCLAISLLHVSIRIL